MPFDDEPRTNHAYVAMKALAANLLSPEEARIMLFLIYPELITPSHYIADIPCTCPSTGRNSDCRATHI